MRRSQFKPLDSRYPHNYLINLINRGAIRMLLDGPYRADVNAIKTFTGPDWVASTDGRLQVYTRQHPETVVAFQPVSHG